LGLKNPRKKEKGWGKKKERGRGGKGGRGGEEVVLFESSLL